MNRRTIAANPSHISVWLRRACAMLPLAHLGRAAAENHFDYRYENYQEDAGRIGVDTQSILFETKITSWLTLHGDAVYDAISGATPTGAPPGTDIKSMFAFPNGPLTTTVPLAHMEDQRYAGALDAATTFGPHHITPQFSYSQEHDYISYGGALNYSLDLNEKNTSLNLGWAHAWDTILPYRGESITENQHKDTDDFLVGVNQILGPKTTLSVNFTFRNSHGYLDDPYRSVVFADYPQDPNDPALWPEKRPTFRQSYIPYVTVLQYITPLHASVEGSYRFYDDTFGIKAHTVDLSWHQKITKRVLVSPVFRYYYQTAADFYAPLFPGDPSLDPSVFPTYYSADYRLSKLQTFTAGVEISAKVTDFLSLDFGYKRYAMYGLDNVTSSSAYPKANIFTIGARLWF
jgi:hypothetical protein